jgi:cytochrome c peroxidase
MRRLITIFSLCLLTAGVLTIDACKKSDRSSSSLPTVITLEIPSNFPQPEDLFKENPITTEGFALGRKLFYDGQLAKDGIASCASCHQQFAAFSTFDHAFSHGIDNQFTTRNAPGIFNMAWHKELHWDGGINHLEVQPLAPLTARNEMGETVENVIRKLNSDTRYREMFLAAFGDENVTSQRMLKALSQFMGMMVSGNAKYDLVMRGKATFSQAEQSGYTIFKAKCVSCHKEPLFTDLSYRNTGIPVNPGLNDFGRMRITRLSQDSLKFKVPSLRNVQVTAPYGHDGRFFSIGAMIDHYRLFVQDGPTVDPLVKKKISISLNEKSDIVQFLNTLTDTVFIKDKRFSQPD